MKRRRPDADDASPRVRRGRLTWLVVSAFVVLSVISTVQLLRGHRFDPSTSAEATRSIATSSAKSPYAAIADRDVRPEPPVPSLGGAGYQFTDPVFRSRMLRVTDANTRPDTVGRSWGSPASPETSAWNTTSTRFFVTGDGGEQIPFDFDPRGMTASRTGNRRNPHGGLVLGFGGEPSFSFLDPDAIYGLQGADPHKVVQYRFATGDEQVLHDIASCLPGIASRGAGISVAADDQRLLTYVGGGVQDQDTHVYVYDRARGCRWLNAETGQVGGEWGPTGTYEGDHGWTIHNARMAKNGKWAKITAGSGSRVGVYFWNIDTLTVSPCPVGRPTRCSGHMVMGFDHVINHRGVTDGMQVSIRPVEDLRSVRPLIVPELRPARFVVEIHPSWNNVRPDETQPMCTEVYRPDGRVERAWDGEIICIETDGLASTVWRFAHHRSQVASFGDQPRANVSQDGRFVLFTSNWEQTLGRGPDGPRHDAFVVGLTPAAASLSARQ